MSEAASEEFIVTPAGETRSERFMLRKRRLFRLILTAVRYPTLQFNILIIFTALFGLMAALLVWQNGTRSKALVERLTEDLIQQVGQTTIQTTRAYLEPVAAAAEVWSHLPRDVLSWNVNNSRLTDYMLYVIDAYPQLYSIYLGYPDGDFLQAIRLPDEAQSRDIAGQYMGGTRSDSLPPDALYAIRRLDRTAEGVSTYWGYLDGAGELVAHEIDTGPAAYDPRDRPWFGAAAASDKKIWTDLYVFESLKQPGISAASAVRSLNGEFLGVTGADVALDRLSQFLKGLKVGETGTVFIVNRRGQVVAHQIPAEAMRREDDAMRPAFVSELSDRRLTEAYQRYIETGAREFRLKDAAGAGQIAVFTPFPDDFRNDWTIGMVIPEADFAAPIQAARRESLLIVAAVMTLMLFAIRMISHWISRPVEQLVAETERILDYDLKDHVRSDSRVREIRDLTRSLDRMKGAFRSLCTYVPQDLARRIIDNDEQMRLGGRRQDMSVLFSDVRNFTGISEMIPAEELMGLMSEYFTVLTDEIRNHSGNVDKYIGDALMAFWGAPEDDFDHVAHMCAGALAARRAILAHRETWMAHGIPELKTRFGLHCGHTVVGNMGSPERMNFTVVGRVPNCAARLEQVNKIYGTKFAASETVYDSARDRFLFRPIDTIILKGFSEPTRIYELIGMYDGPADLRADPDMIALCDRYNEGFQAYLEQRFGDALEIYLAIMRDEPEDQIAPLFVVRCRHYMKTPPPRDWNRTSRVGLTHRLSTDINPK